MGGRPGRRGRDLASASDWALLGAGPAAAHMPALPLSAPGQVVMTIIVAFILEAFVFRMNYSRKNQDSEGVCKSSRGRSLPAAHLAGCPAVGCLAVGCLAVRPRCLPVGCLAVQPRCLAVQASGSSAYLSGVSVTSLVCIAFQILNDGRMLSISCSK